MLYPAGLPSPLPLDRFGHAPCCEDFSCSYRPTYGLIGAPSNVFRPCLAPAIRFRPGFPSGPAFHPKIAVYLLFGLSKHALRGLGLLFMLYQPVSLRSALRSRGGYAPPAESPVARSGMFVHLLYSGYKSCPIDLSFHHRVCP